MAKKIVNFHEVARYYSDMIEPIRTQIHDAIRELIKKMGGKICTYWYHSEKDCTRYTYFDVNSDGYGVELFVKQILTDGTGEPYFVMGDSEDGYEAEWELADFNASNSLYLLQELEEIAQCANDEGEEIRKEYDDED